MATSADISFRLIASSKKLLTRGQIGEAVERAESSGSSLEAAVDELGFLSSEDFERIVSTRERHGRDCSSCGDVTFMLPKQKPATTPCEHCQGQLILTAADKRPRGPSGRKPAGAPPKPAAPRATGRRILSKAERESQAPAGPPPSAAHRASQEAAAASASSVGDITFSAPPEELAALRAEASPASDPLEAATPPGAGAQDDDLDFRSMAYDPDEIAKAREEAAAQVQSNATSEAAPESAASPRHGPPTTSEGGAPDDEAPTLAPSKLKDAGSGSRAQSAIGSPVKPPSSSPRDLRQQGGGFGYEPPEELAPRPPRPGAPRKGETSSQGETVKAPSSSPRDLRQQGGGFGYEPPEELAARPSRRGFGAGLAAGSALVGSSAGSDTVGEPAAHDDDDDRFAPRVEHFTEHSHQEEEVHVPLLREDIKRILKLPVEKSGIGMLILGTLMVSVSTMIPLTPFTLLPALAFMAYPITFLIDCTRYGSLGRNHLPNFPDFDMGLIANLWRTIQVWFACAMPAIVILLPIFLLMSTLGSSKNKQAHALPVFSIGEAAYDARRMEKDWHVPKGTDMSGTVFVEPGTDADVTLGGEWTVVGLLNRSNADDTMTTVEFTDMGAASALGSGGIPGFQAHDLDRVGRAMAGSVKVYATYADPDERIVRGRFPWLRPGGGSEDWEEPEADPDDPQAAREAAARDALDKAGQKMTFNRAKRNRDNGIYVTNRFQGLQVLKTSAWTFPGAFEGIKPLPVVYVLNAEGKVVMEYGSGVDDEQLYGDLQNLMRGGDGGGSRKMLPPHIKPPQGFGLASMAAGGGLVIMILILIPVVLAGYFYWPAAQLIMVTFDSGAMAFNYPAAIRAIRAGFKDYLALVGIIVGLSFVGMLIGQLISMILFFAPGFIRGGVSSFVSSVFYFYSQVVGAYAIGRYYYVNKEAIGWFGGR